MYWWKRLRIWSASAKHLHIFLWLLFYLEGGCGCGRQGTGCWSERQHGTMTPEAGFWTITRLGLEKKNGGCMEKRRGAKRSVSAQNTWHNLQYNKKVSGSTRQEHRERGRSILAVSSNEQCWARPEHDLHLHRQTVYWKGLELTKTHASTKPVRLIPSSWGTLKINYTGQT